MNTKDLSGIVIVVRMKLLNTAGKQFTTLTGIRRKLLIGKAGIPRKIKETIHSLKIKETIHSFKNPNHINKISYMLPEIWLSNLRYFLVNYLCYIRRF